jgi:hypothetical protein
MMIRGDLAPALRALGFKGSGQVYTLPDAENWALVGIQRSQFSDRNDLRFTINLTVADKAMWAKRRADHLWLPERPSANTSYGGDIWQARIGQLMPERPDKWWRISPDTDVARLAAEFLAAIRDLALPAMRSRMRRDAGSADHIADMAKQ